MVDVDDGFLILTYSLSCSLTLQLLKASVKPNQLFSLFVEFMLLFVVTI